MRTIRPCPSPNGTNHEKLYLVRMGRGGPSGALDSVKRHGDGERDDGERDSRLRAALEELIVRHCPEDSVEEIFGELDRHLPAKHYGEENEADDEHEENNGEEHEQRLRRMLSAHMSDDDATEIIEALPKNAREGGAGGRLAAKAAELEGKDRRRAKDRRPGAMDSAEIFEKWFGAARIKQAI